MEQTTSFVDSQSEDFLALLAEQERVKSHCIAGVKTVLVILSSKAMVFDMESLRQKILLAYGDAAVFFRSTSGQSIGYEAPNRVDLLIDFTAPGSRQGLFYSRRLRSMAKTAIGRDAGFFRKKVYDRVFDEKSAKNLPDAPLMRERAIQRQVLILAGVPLFQMGDTEADRGQSIALELPAMKRL